MLIDIYGYRAHIQSSCACAMESLAEDFAFFQSTDESGAHIIELLDEEPPYSEMPPLTANVYTPRNVSYRDGCKTYVDYSGRALGIHDRSNGNFRLYSKDPDMLYEAAYLFLLSQCGAAFDARHLHRVHALGVSLEGRAALVLLPMGGGKSTLGSELLKFPDIELLSDDSPLIDRNGTIHAFPLRLGLLPDAAGAVPKDHLRRINRMEFGPKLLVNYKYFSDRVRAAADPGVLFLGRRSLANTCEITPAGGVTALHAMTANCIVGMGLFQGMEFIFQQSGWELTSKAAVAYSRFAASVRLIRRSRVCHLSLGRDRTENARVVHEFLRSLRR
jgi:hypothetical protein